MRDLDPATLAGGDVSTHRSASRLVTRYTHGPGIDEPLKMTEYDTAGSIFQTSYLHRDALGSVTGVTNGNGAVVALYHYAAFGAPAEPGNLRYRFTSREWEGDLFLYYYRARMYDPRVGRFNAYDPISNSIGAKGYAPYLYCNNNPLIYIDRFGLAYQMETTPPTLPTIPYDTKGPYNSMNSLLKLLQYSNWNFWNNAKNIYASSYPNASKYFGLYLGNSQNTPVTFSANWI